MKSKKGSTPEDLSSKPSPQTAADLFADFEPAKPSQEKYGKKFVFDCEICGARMLEHHCKILCPGCGYVRDCSDP